MPNYKDLENKVHWLDDAKDFSLLPVGSVEITQAEADTLNAPTFIEAQEKMWSLIKAERDRRSSTGFLEPVSGKWFHSDDKSRTQQLGMTIMGAGLPIDIDWKTMDGSFIQLTPAIVGNLFAAIAASDQAIFATAEMHKATMLLEADPTTYNYSGGWPLAFGE